MTTSTTSTTTGSLMAREVGLLHAAFPSNGKWDNIWNIMLEYNRAVGNNTSPPPLAATWSEMEKDVTPVFQQTEVNTSNKSLLSPNPTAEAFERYSHAVKLMDVFELNSNDANCQALVAWFAQNEVRIRPKEFQRSVFRRHAFAEPHAKVTKLTART